MKGVKVKGEYNRIPSRIIFKIVTTSFIYQISLIFIPFYILSELYKYIALPSSASEVAMVTMRRHDMDLYINHFSEWWIVMAWRAIEGYLVGKRVVCTPYIPEVLPLGVKHLVHLYFQEHLPGLEEVQLKSNQ